MSPIQYGFTQAEQFLFSPHTIFDIQKLQGLRRRLLQQSCRALTQRNKLDRLWKYLETKRTLINNPIGSAGGRGISYDLAASAIQTTVLMMLIAEWPISTNSKNRTRLFNAPGSTGNGNDLVSRLCTVTKPSVETVGCIQQMVPRGIL